MDIDDKDKEAIQQIENKLLFILPIYEADGDLRNLFDNFTLSLIFYKHISYSIKKFNNTNKLLVKILLDVLNYKRYYVIYAIKCSFYTYLQHLTQYKHFNSFNEIIEHFNNIELILLGHNKITPNYNNYIDTILKNIIDEYEEKDTESIITLIKKLNVIQKTLFVIINISQ